MTRKNNVVSKQPLAYQALQKVGYGYLLGVLAFGIAGLVLDVREKTINNYQYLSVLSGLSIGDMTEINYYSRLMHIGYYHPQIFD
jgi:hypothetical protein